MNATLAWEFIVYWGFLPPALAAAMLVARQLTEAIQARAEQVRMPRRDKAGPAFFEGAASIAVRGGQ